MEEEQAVTASESAPDNTPAAPPEDSAPSSPAETTVETPEAESVPERTKARIEQLLAEREYWRGVAASTAQTTKVADEEAPTADKFETYEEYLSAFTSHKIAEESKKQAFLSKIQKDPEAISLVTDQTIPISIPLAKAIQGSDEPGKVLKYFKLHPQEAHKMSMMDAVSAARALGRLEERLAAPAPVKKVSAAPPPVNSLSGTGGGIGKDVTDSELATEDRIRLWRKK